jgi:serine/threonine protein kinase
VGPLRRVGKYELVELIAEGGMGRLYRARDSNPGGLDRDVALKIIREDLATEAREHFATLFTEEAKILSKLTHANIIHIYELGEDGRTLFISMELVEGRDLAKIIALRREKRAGPLEQPLLLHIVEQISRGLDYAHRLGVAGSPLKFIHRDVSPSNILVSFDGAVKLTDFGVARIQRATPLTRSGVIKGKTAYMAPEYLSTGDADSRADVFSLGVVLWEGLTGRRLFPENDDADRRRHILNGTIAPPSKMEPAVPKALDGVVLRALERNPDHRYPSARDMGNDLRELAQVHHLLADDVDLAKELRRLFPGDVPATAMDLRGLTRKRVIVPEQSEPPSLVTEEVSRPGESGPTPVVVESGDLLEATPSTGSTAAKVTQRLPVARTEPDPLLQSALGTTTTPERPWLKQGLSPPQEMPPLQHLPPQDPPAPVPAPAPHRRWRVWGTLAGAAVLSVGGLAWWLRSPTASPTVTAAPTETSTPTLATAPGPTPTAKAIPTPTATPTPTESPSVRPERSRGANPIPPAATHPAHASHTRAAAPPHPLKPGTLAVIAVHPWAQVFVDGTSRGYSPAPAIPIPAGRHKIILSNDEAHLSRTFSVNVPEGGRVVFRGELETLKPSVGTE